MDRDDDDNNKNNKLWTPPLPPTSSSSSDLDESYGISSDVEDPEVFDAVFPSATELIRLHALLPFLRHLRALIAHPSALYVALLPPPNHQDPGHPQPLTVQSLGTLTHKVATYERQSLATIGWSWERAQRVIEDLNRQHSDGDGDGWTSTQLIRQVDTVMLKLARFYLRMWRYLTTLAINLVHHVEVTILTAHAQWLHALDNTPGPPAASLSPVYDGKASQLEMIVRPLRLRAESTSASASASASASSSVAPMPRASTTMSMASAPAIPHRRARLARESNEFLTAWFLAHKKNPYPSGAERAQIAQKTGLTEQQVRNWFANMRKRHWKPKQSVSKKPRSLLDMLLRQDQHA